MMIDQFEENLEGYDDRFEVSGEVQLGLPNDFIAEIERLIFAWDLSNPEDDMSLQDLVLVLVGGKDDISKVLATIRGSKVQMAKGKKGKHEPKAWVVLKLHKEVLREVVTSAIDEKMGQVPFFMVGTKRTLLVFDMMNYDIVASEV